MLLTALSALTACGGSTVSTKGLSLSRADTAITKPCRGPVLLPERLLNQADVERYWSIDRARLVRCKGEKQEVVRYYDTLFARLAHKPH
jgi:hypothetical protein